MKCVDHRNAHTSGTSCFTTPNSRSTVQAFAELIPDTTGLAVSHGTKVRTQFLSIDGARRSVCRLRLSTSMSAVRVNTQALSKEEQGLELPDPICSATVSAAFRSYGKKNSRPAVQSLSEISASDSRRPPPVEACPRPEGLPVQQIIPHDGTVLTASRRLESLDGDGSHILAVRVQILLRLLRGAACCALIQLGLHRHARRPGCVRLEDSRGLQRIQGFG